MGGGRGDDLPKQSISKDFGILFKISCIKQSDQFQWLAILLVVKRFFEGYVLARLGTRRVPGVPRGGMGGMFPPMNLGVKGATAP